MVVATVAGIRVMAWTGLSPYARPPQQAPPPPEPPALTEETPPAA
jgi:hypothetical protein